MQQNQEPDHPYIPRQQKKGRRHLRVFSVVLMVVFALLLIYGAAQLFFKQQDTDRVEAINAENRSLLGTDEPTSTPVSPTATAAPATPRAESTLKPVTEPESPRHTKDPNATIPPVQGKFDDLIVRNAHTIGWLKVDAVYRIDFAVVQSDNDFYMTHDFTGGENREGCAFLDETNVLWPRDNHLIIYAHNMKSGSMFGELNKLSDETVLRSNPFVCFDSLYESGDYIPFAIINCNVSDQKAENYFNFYVRNFKTSQAFEQFLAKARLLSLVDLNKVDVRESDDLLTLSTCYDDANKTRFIVMLRRLRDDETRESALQKYFVLSE